MTLLRYNTHACLSIFSEKGTCITSDPWILDSPVYAGCNWRMPYLTDDSREDIISFTDFLYISHTHEDHFHPESLKLFNKKIPIIIPKFEWCKHTRRNLLKDSLISMGFKNIIQLSSWENLEISKDLKITLVPSSSSRNHDWENSGLIIDVDNIKILNLNDNIPDELLLNRVRDFISPNQIDVALVQSTGVSNYPSRFLLDNIKRAKACKDKLADNFRHEMIC